MNIAIDASSARVGGGVVILRNLLDFMATRPSRFPSVTVVGVEETLKNVAIWPGLTLLSPPVMKRGRIRRAIWLRYGLPQLLREIKADVVLSTGGPLLGRVPCNAVTMLTNMLPFETGEWSRFGLGPDVVRLATLSRLYRHSVRNSDCVVFLSKYSAELVQNKCGPVKHIVTPHGVDARFSCWPRPERPFDYYSAARPFQLLYVSPLAPYKHQESVMRAVALLQADGVPVVLRLVGGGDRRRADQIRRRLAHSGEGAFIKYDGAVPHAELPQVYREADAFVFASTCECCPVTLGEAMSSGLPILCSDRPVIREMACDSGVYFEPEQPASIAAAIRRIVEDNELRAMSARRAFELSTCRTWDSHFEAILGALTDLADFNMKVYSRN